MKEPLLERLRKSELPRPPEKESSAGAIPPPGVGEGAVKKPAALAALLLDCSTNVMNVR
jgi:hypothetical protein